jgi:hypothetical protein
MPQKFDLEKTWRSSGNGIFNFTSSGNVTLPYGRSVVKISGKGADGNFASPSTQNYSLNYTVNAYSTPTYSPTGVYNPVTHPAVYNTPTYGGGTYNSPSTQNPYTITNYGSKNYYQTPGTQNPYSVNPGSPGGATGNYNIKYTFLCCQYKITYGTIYNAPTNPTYSGGNYNATNYSVLNYNSPTYGGGTYNSPSTQNPYNVTYGTVSGYTTSGGNQNYTKTYVPSTYGYGTPTATGTYNAATPAAAGGYSVVMGVYIPGGPAGTNSPNYISSASPYISPTEINYYSYPDNATYPVSIPTPPNNASITVEID